MGSTDLNSGGATRTRLLIMALLAGFGLPSSATAQAFIRGDVNADENVDIADSISILNQRFQGGPRVLCDDAADTNDDGQIDISDAVFVLLHLFLGGPELPPPFPEAGADPTADALGCGAAPELTVLRHGYFSPFAHDVGGTVEHLSDGTIRIRRFFYDGDGLPDVVIWIHSTLAGARDGTAISGDLRGRRYRDETLVLPLPEGVGRDDFLYVSVWCTWFPQIYGFARLFDD